MSRLLIATVVFGLAPLAGCIGTSAEASFVERRTEDTCNGVWHVCKGQTAGCVLSTDKYLTGTFPGSRKFLVETTPGDWKIRVLIFLKERLSPGTETEIAWNEPGCTDEYRFQLSKGKKTGDLFEQSGRDQVFATERAVTEAGDHLITIWSDSIARYNLRVELNKKN